MDNKHNTHGWKISFKQPDNTQLIIQLSGKWHTKRHLPNIDVVTKKLASEPQIKSITFDCEKLEGFDTGLVLFIAKLTPYADTNGISINTENLPHGVTQFLKISSRVKKEEAPQKKTDNFITKLGFSTIRFINRIRSQLEFIGEIIFSFIRLFVGRAFFLGKDLQNILYASSIKAIGIVGLIAFLTGVILAFIGSVQLSKFGAEIYIANLTSIGMARELAPIMTSIVMSGLTGASFAAHIGTMQVNEEIDALSTTAISPMDFIVLPRLIALIVMMPILTVFAIALGNVGGYVIASHLIKISSMEYINQVRDALTITDIVIGLIKGLIFGILVAYSGCLRGMQCGRSALAVGESTTTAVVSAIVLIISADAIIDFILYVLEL